MNVVNAAPPSAGITGSDLLQTQSQSTTQTDMHIYQTPRQQQQLQQLQQQQATVIS